LHWRRCSDSQENTATSTSGAGAASTTRPGATITIQTARPTRFRFPSRTRSLRITVDGRPLALPPAPTKAPWNSA